MKISYLLNFSFFLFFVLFLMYLFEPSPSFPPPPPDSLQSNEPADTESDYRRAYFTDYTREQVIMHYKAHFGRLVVLRLNYPPEDAVTLIRDQTRSYYLEELVHPMRESLFINGFVPQEDKDDIWIDNRHFEQKITIRYIPTDNKIRLVIGFLAGILGYIIFNSWIADLKGIYRRWIYQ